MSATPIPEDFQPVEFEDIEYKEVDWKDVETIQVLPYHTNKPYMIVTKIIKAYQENGFIEVDGQKSKEAYFFVNSVTEIKKILTQAELKDDDCRIICAKNGTTKRLWERIIIFPVLQTNRRSLILSLPNLLKVWIISLKQVYALSSVTHTVLTPY
mgnify:CR=1 FL=1